MAFESVWLVDDDALSNYVNGLIIKTEHFARKIVTFTRVSEALAALDPASRQLEYELPDVIFLDMEMPGLDGWDFLKAFEKLPHHVKDKSRLYMLSSSINEADAKKARQYEYLNDFISKPLTREGLGAIASTLFNKPG